METFGGVLAAILIAIFISAIFYFALSIRGPWGTFWTFFIVLLLAIWAADVWVRPIGPVYWGISWVPLFFIGIVVALLLAAIPTNDSRPEEEETIVEEDLPADRAEVERREDTDLAAAAAVGWFFWGFILFLFLAIMIGYAV